MYLSLAHKDTYRTYLVRCISFEITSDCTKKLSVVTQNILKIIILGTFPSKSVSSHKEFKSICVYHVIKIALVCWYADWLLQTIPWKVSEYV